MHEKLVYDVRTIVHVHIHVQYVLYVYMHTYMCTAYIVH